jgi:hypothetical protein
VWTFGRFGQFGFEYKLKIFSSREEWRTIIETMLWLMKMDGCFENVIKRLSLRWMIRHTRQTRENRAKIELALGSARASRPLSVSTPEPGSDHRALHKITRGIWFEKSCTIGFCTQEALKVKRLRLSEAKTVMECKRSRKAHFASTLFAGFASPETTTSTLEAVELPWRVQKARGAKKSQIKTKWTFNK